MYDEQSTAVCNGVIDRDRTITDTSAHARSFDLPNIIQYNIIIKLLVLDDRARGRRCIVVATPYFYYYFFSSFFSLPFASFGFSVLARGCHYTTAMIRPNVFQWKICGTIKMEKDNRKDSFDII